MRLSLTEFVDVVSKVGARKASLVATIKVRSLEDYSPGKDFYKQLRDAIVALHKANEPKHRLDSVLFSVTEKNRRSRYAKLVPAYKAWLGKKHVRWIQPTTALYQHGDVFVAVNPEVGLEINGVRYVIKLYFKTELLEKQGAALITALMAASLPSDNATQFAVLDVERGKLHVKPDKPIEPILAMANAELAYVAHLLSSLGDKAA